MDGLREVWQIISDLLALEADVLNAGEMALRALIVYIYVLAIIRLGDKRFLGKNTAFDVVLAIMLGSVASRAITGSSPFFPSLVASAVLVGLHWLLSWLSFRSDNFGNVVKGHRRVLVKDGEIQWDAMAKTHLSRNDLKSSLRTQAQIDDLSRVKVARLERNGAISVLEFEPEPKIVDVDVAEGVQTIRIEIE